MICHPDVCFFGITCLQTNAEISPSFQDVIASISGGPSHLPQLKIIKMNPTSLNTITLFPKMFALTVTTKSKLLEPHFGPLLLIILKVFSCILYGKEDNVKPEKFLKCDTLLSTRK
jgi:hypothetical protein